MRRTRSLVVSLLVALLAVGVSPVNAGGVSPEKLEKAGWDCFPNSIDPDRIKPCVKDLDALLAGDGATHTILTFNIETGEFLGTELLIHKDLYNEQPCPQDEVEGGDGLYIDLSELGLDYYVCHHFDSPIT